MRFIGSGFRLELHGICFPCTLYRQDCPFRLVYR